MIETKRYRFCEGKHVVYVAISLIDDTLKRGCFIDYKAEGYIWVYEHELNDKVYNNIITNWTEISKDAFEEIQFLTYAGLNGDRLTF